MARSGWLIKNFNTIYWWSPPIMSKILSSPELRALIVEELTKTDKEDIKKMISKEMDKSLKSELKKILADELSKAIKSKNTKDDIGEITKKVLKKLYKDLSFHHPYIIDRIKV